MPHVQRHSITAWGLVLVMAAALILPPPGRGITFGEEEELSAELLRIIFKKLPVVDDPYVTAYINRVGKRILSVMPEQPFRYHFYVINQDAYNAFATPAGHIFVYSGLLEAMDGEDELAGILGHEISHEPVAPPRDSAAYIRYFCGDVENPYALKENELKPVKLYKTVSHLLRVYAVLANEMADAGFTPERAQEIERERLRRIMDPATDVEEFRHELNNYLTAMADAIRLLNEIRAVREELNRSGWRPLEILAQSKRSVAELSTEDLIAMRAAYANAPAWREQPSSLRSLLNPEVQQQGRAYIAPLVPDNCADGINAGITNTDIAIADAFRIAAEAIQDVITGAFQFCGGCGNRRYQGGGTGLADPQEYQDREAAVLREALERGPLVVEVAQRVAQGRLRQHVRL